MKQAAFCSQWEGKKMSKKMTYIICVVLFVLLAVLMVCERINPEAGTVWLTNLFG